MTLCVQPLSCTSGPAGSSAVVLSAHRNPRWTQDTSHQVLVAHVSQWARGISILRSGIVFLTSLYLFEWLNLEHFLLSFPIVAATLLWHHSRSSVPSASLIPVPPAAKHIQGLRGLPALLQEQPSRLCAHQFLCKALENPRVDVLGMLLLGMLPPPFCPVGFSQVSVPCGQDLLPATRLFCSCHRAPEICLFLLNKPKTHKVPL